jgi:uncharacterized protein (DUF849 family)
VRQRSAHGPARLGLQDLADRRTAGFVYDLHVLQAALNGSRDPGEHPAIPRTPEALAREARAAVAAGAEVLHVHVHDPDGRETFQSEPTAQALTAIRAATPGVPISLSTSVEIEADPARRLAVVSTWTALPDLVTANQGEPGIVELCEHLIGRGVGIEAGLLEASDAEAFVASGLAPRCVRAMAEPLEHDSDAALAQAAAIEEILTRAGIGLPQVHHGDQLASWAVNERAVARGHGIRTGLEDTVVLPDGSPPEGNGDLVRAAAQILAGAE